MASPPCPSAAGLGEDLKQIERVKESIADIIGQLGEGDDAGGLSFAPFLDLDTQITVVPASKSLGSSLDELRSSPSSSASSSTSSSMSALESPSECRPKSSESQTELLESHPQDPARHGVKEDGAPSKRSSMAGSSSSGRGTSADRSGLRSNGSLPTAGNGPGRTVGQGGHQVTVLPLKSFADQRPGRVACTAEPETESDLSPSPLHARREGVPGSPETRPLLRPSSSSDGETLVAGLSGRPSSRVSLACEDGAAACLEAAEAPSACDGAAGKPAGAGCGGCSGGGGSGGGGGGSRCGRRKRSGCCCCRCCGHSAVRAQAKAVVSVLLAVLAAPAALFAAYEYLPYEAPVCPDLASRMVYALRCGLFTLFPTVFGVLAQGVVRLCACSGGSPGRRAERERGVNTWGRHAAGSTEQLLLYLLNLLALASYLQQADLKVLPSLAALFAIGRLVYLLSCVLCPGCRGFGFSLVFVPVLAMLSYNLYCLFTLGLDRLFLQSSDLAPTAPSPPRLRFWG
ncbi:uncharacterized protein LOC144722008 [Lampetra planeri]